MHKLNSIFLGTFIFNVSLESCQDQTIKPAETSKKLSYDETASKLSDEIFKNKDNAVENCEYHVLGMRIHPKIFNKFNQKSHVFIDDKNLKNEEGEIVENVVGKVNEFIQGFKSSPDINKDVVVIANSIDGIYLKPDQELKDMSLATNVKRLRFITINGNGQVKSDTVKLFD